MTVCSCCLESRRGLLAILDPDVVLTPMRNRSRITPDAQPSSAPRGTHAKEFANSGLEPDIDGRGDLVMVHSTV